MQGSLLAFDHTLILPHLPVFIGTSETHPSDKLIFIRALEREEQIFFSFLEKLEGLRLAQRGQLA